MDNRINNRIYHNHGKFHKTIVMNPFKQIMTFLEISNWFWITLCHTFELFSCSNFFINIYFIFNALLNVYHQGYVICNLFFVIFFILYCVYHIHRKKTQSLSEELVCTPFPILNLCHDICHSQPPQISKMEDFAKIVNA